MIGQRTDYVKPQSPLVAPLLSSSDHPASAADQVLAAGICPPFTSACPSSCTAPTFSSVPLPTPSDLRRLAIKAPHPTHLLKCPRCDSLDTKFCYYNNYSLSQPRYFCKNCKRYWTAGGALRNVPVGGGLRKNKRSKLIKLPGDADQAAAAIAASSRDSAAVHDDSAQLHHYHDLNPHSPVLASSSTAAIGSSSSSGNSSVVSGIPANFIAAPVPPCFHSSNAPTHLMRTSSGSDGSTIEYAGNDNCSSINAAAALQRMARSQQNGSNQLQHFFGDQVCGHAAASAPQFYPGYSTGLQASNLQQHYIGAGGSSNDQISGSASYQAMGYVHQLAQGGSCSSTQVLGGRDEVAGVSPPCADNYSGVISSNGGRDVCSKDQLQQKEELISNNSHYDWQLSPDINLFHGASSEGFLPLPGSTWPDFLQFQDLSGPV